VWYKIRKSNQLLIHLTSFWLFTLQLARFYSSVFIADQLTLGHYIVYSNPRLFAKLRAWYVIMMKSLCVWTRKISVRVQSVSFCWMHGFNNVVYWTDFNKIMKIIDEGCWCLTFQDLLVFLSMADESHWWLFQWQFKRKGLSALVLLFLKSLGQRHVEFS